VFLKEEILNRELEFPFISVFPSGEFIQKNDEKNVYFSERRDSEQGI